MRIKLFTAAMIFLAASAVNYAQGEFDIALLPYSSQEQTLAKLKEFQQGGIELPMEMAAVTADDLIEAAKQYEGMKHKLGAKGSNDSIDCSGLLYAAFRDVGITTGIHGSQEMARFGKIITDKAELKKGDLVFFVNTYSTEKVITHSGFMINDRQWIHASHKNGVEIINLEDPYYWNNHFLYGTRLF